MFTGIIEEKGKIQRVEKLGTSCVLYIQAEVVTKDTKIGDSIAVNGVCLTVTRLLQNGFAADVMHETLNRSSLAAARPGTSVNLERAMPCDGRFGGHIVAGHIDGQGIVTSVERDANAVWYTVETSAAIMRYIVEKGSVALDGISLTVAAVAERKFKVSVIPHTASATTLSERKKGDAVNIENDCVGKYIEKFLQMPDGEGQKGMSKTFLARYGYL